MTKTYDIYIPNDREPFPTVNVVLAASILIPVLYLFFDDFIEEYLPERLFFALPLIAYSGLIFRAIVLMNKVEPLNGKIEGKITFTENSILINEKELDLTSIKKINFAFVLAYAEKYSARRTHRFSNPYLPNGTQNWIELTYNNDKKEKIYFQRFEDNVDPVLNNLYEFLYYKGKISFLRLTELLGIHEYEDIQAFKAKMKAAN